MADNSRPENGAAFDLCARTKLRVAGTDALRFLNGQISNDLRKAREDAAVHACVLNAKGKINAEVFVVADGDGFLLDSDEEVRESLAARLERYVIADDVTITDVSDRLGLFHLTTSDPPSAVPHVKAARAERFGSNGVDLWIEDQRVEEARQLIGQLLPLCDAARAEVLRIERGQPRWGRELGEEIIPQEANLEASTIDYAKGCYIGQEVISRMKMSGQTNKRLCGLVPDQDTVLAPGARLTAPADGKDAGWITSVAKSDRLERVIALGFVKRGFWHVGTELLAGEAPVRVAALPLA